MPCDFRMTEPVCSAWVSLAGLFEAEPGFWLVVLDAKTLRNGPISIGSWALLPRRERDLEPDAARTLSATWSGSPMRCGVTVGPEAKRKLSGERKRPQAAPVAVGGSGEPQTV